RGIITVWERVILSRMTTSGAAGTRLAVLGAGTVGSALLGRLEGRADVKVTGVLVRDPDRRRSAMKDRSVLTTDPETALAAADVVVELLGGTGLAVELMLKSLAQGRRVITGNKAA